MDIAEIIAEFRCDHKRYTDSEYEEGTGRRIEWEGCEHCESETWPCPTIALCDAYEALETKDRERRENFPARLAAAAHRASRR